MSMEELSEVQGRPWDDVDVSNHNYISFMFCVITESCPSTDATRALRCVLGVNADAGGTLSRNGL